MSSSRGVISDLTDEEAYLYAILQDHSGLDLMEFSRWDGSSYDGCFRAWPFQWSWWRTRAPLQIDQSARSVGKSLSILARMYAFPFRHPGQEAVITAPELIHLEPIIGLIEGQFFTSRLGREILQTGRSAVTHRPFMMCIAEGQFVLTSRGHVPIEDVCVGDEVLTHEGRWRPVTAVMDNGVRSTVELRGTGSRLTVTPDHPLLARRVKQREVKGALRRRMERVMLDPEWIAPNEWRTSGPATRWASPVSIPETSTPIPFRLNKRGFGVGQGRLVLPLSPEFLWLLGHYVAEGCTVGSLVSLSVHDEEVAEVGRRLDKVGIHWYVRPGEHGATRGRNIRITNAPLAEFFRTHAPGLAPEKDVPLWIHGLGPDLQRAFLDGFLYGDGHLTAAGAWTGSQASRKLVISLRLMANHLGWSSGTSPVKPRTSMSRGLTIDSGPSWQWYLNPHHGAHIHTTFEFGHAWTAMTRIKDAGPNRVFDLEVADDHSFVVEGQVVHNCFKNGARLIGRIPQRDGKGVKGLHPIQLEMDESQDYPKRGWTELNETLKRGFEGAEWRAHGVTRGVRDKFYEYTQDKPSNPWKVHRYAAMWRPTWTDEERQEAITKYGGHRDDPDYRRNVLGLHGDATAALFVTTRLMACVDDDESSDYNEHEYVHLDISDMMVEELGPGGDPSDLLLFPDKHRDYTVTWCGMDVGLTHDPSEILVFGEYHPDADERKVMTTRKKACPKVGLSRFKLLSRISLKRVANPDQLRLILAIIAFYRPKAFGLDKTGIGLPLYQDLLAMIREEGEFSAAAQAAAQVIKGYNFSAKVIVDIDETIQIDEIDGDQVRDAGIHRNVLEQSTDTLREYVDTERMWLPWDDQLISEYEGQTFSYSKSAIDQFGRARRVFSEGRFHALDASRMFAMAHSQQAIEAIVGAKNENEAVIARFFQPGL